MPLPPDNTTRRNTLPMPSLAALLVPIVLAAALSGAAAAEPADLGSRATAVALNYSRTSFHRIRRYPSKRVLLEEQEKVLNNLNLNGIADEEVVKLYGAVLEEIAHVQIADEERVIIRTTHSKLFRRQLTATAFQLSEELVAQRYVAAVRTGVNSWWDYRDMVDLRELDSWRLDKERMLAVADKSAHFLDTFWKMARFRNIPDRWLVRSDDLDRLEAAVREPDLEIRLRVLKRMEQFMECYPPYWYYVGRTQQQLGKLEAAARTYETLIDLGAGYFRNDEMLAAGAANLAMIRDYLKLPEAAGMAHEGLRFATHAWEVNLMCAKVLERHGEFEDAEDAVLRNLDVNLETEQSLACLLSLYCHSRQFDQLQRRLNDPETHRLLPLPTLLQAASVLPVESIPKSLLTHTIGTMSAYYDLRFGPDDLVVLADPRWQPASARIGLHFGDQQTGQPVLNSVRDKLEVRFSRLADVGSPLSSPAGPPALTLVLNYADGAVIRIALQQVNEPAEARGTGVEAAPVLDRAGVPLPARNTAFRMTALQIGEAVVPLLSPKPEVPILSTIVPGRPRRSPAPRTPQPRPSEPFPYVPPAPADPAPPASGPSLPETLFKGLFRSSELLSTELASDRG